MALTTRPNSVKHATTLQINDLHKLVQLKKLFQAKKNIVVSGAGMSTNTGGIVALQKKLSSKVR
jgi:hypothetical protein